MYNKRPLTKDEDISWLGIRWQPTMRCNFNCFFCLQHQYKHHDDKIEKQILNNSLDNIDKAFSYGKLKWWKIIGGEFIILPLSIRDRILEIAKKHKPYLYLTTNGSNLKWLEPFREVGGEVLISLHDTDTETDIFKTIEDGKAFSESHPNFYVKYAIVAKDNLETVIKASSILKDNLIVQACREKYINKITDEYRQTPEYKWIVEHNYGNSYNNRYYSSDRTEDFECIMRGIVIDYNGRIRLCHRNKTESYDDIMDALNELPKKVICNNLVCTKCNGQIFSNVYTQVNAFDRLLRLKRK